jgi:hypothetical protein
MINRRAQTKLQRETSIDPGGRPVDYPQQAADHVEHLGFIKGGINVAVTTGRMAARQVPFVPRTNDQSNGGSAQERIIFDLPTTFIAAKLVHVQRKDHQQRIFFFDDRERLGTIATFHEFKPLLSQEGIFQNPA